MTVDCIKLLIPLMMDVDLAEHIGGVFMSMTYYAYENMKLALELFVRNGLLQTMVSDLHDAVSVYCPRGGIIRQQLHTYNECCRWNVRIGVCIR